MKHSEILKIVAKQNGKVPKNKELAQILGLTMDGVRSRAFRDKEYGFEEVQKIFRYYGVKILPDKKNIVDNLLIEQQECLDKKDEFGADLYPDVFGSCGSGVFVLSETKEKINVPKKIVENYSEIKKYSVINAVGDSMQPYIQDRDLLIVEHVENNEQIKDNRVYVFCYDDKIFVKRLVLNINQLVIKSDNIEYQPITLINDDLNRVHVIGRIVGLMRCMR